MCALQGWEQIGRFADAPGRISMPRRRKPERPESKPGQPDDRAWSAHTSVHPRSASKDLAAYTALPAETGPTWAPDHLSVWPVEGGRFGIDAHYHWQTGVERANAQRQRLDRLGLTATVREDDAGALIRLGPLAHSAAWLALEALLRRPAADLHP